MKCPNLVQGDSEQVCICTRLGHLMINIFSRPTWTNAHCLILCLVHGANPPLFLGSLNILFPYLSLNKSQHSTLSYLKKWRRKNQVSRLTLSLVLLESEVVARRFILKLSLGDSELSATAAFTDIREYIHGLTYDGTSSHTVSQMLVRIDMWILGHMRSTTAFWVVDRFNYRGKSWAEGVLEVSSKIGRTWKWKWKMH